MGMKTNGILSQDLKEKDWGSYDLLSSLEITIVLCLVPEKNHPLLLTGTLRYGDGLSAGE